MAGSRVPWIRVDVDADQSDKVQSLPSGDARWAWVRMMLRAKTARRMGVFASRRALAEMLGPQGRHVADLVRVGLAHDLPTTCDRCTAAYPDARSGEVVVHDFRKEQRDPTNAERQAGWRDRSNAERNGEVTLMSRPDNAASGPTVTAKSRQSHGDVTTDSRARGMTVTVTETETYGSEVPLSAEPPARSRTRGTPPTSGGNGRDPGATAWKDFGPEWDGFRAAWFERGFRLPPTGTAGEDDSAEQSQRRMLATVVDGWPGSVAAWVREAPAGAPAHAVVGHVLRRYREAVAARQAQVDADEARWQADKAAERSGAGRALDELDFGGEAA